MTTFDDLEAAGWNQNASVYDEVDLPLMGQSIPGILDALGDISGRRVLEIASGTGHLAAAAVARGASVTGIDVARAMVEIARQTAPVNATFDVGNAEALDFPDATFDAVMCSFGLLHFGDADRALAEMARVVKPGGRAAFTVWEAPERGGDFLGLLLSTMATHGDMDVDLPPAPPIFAFADREQTAPRLSAAGFIEVEFSTIGNELPITGEGVAYDFMVNGGVRSRMIYEAQSPEKQVIIREKLIERVRGYIADGKTAIPSPSVLISAGLPG